MQRDGPAALRVILREHRQPLSALLIDASIEQWERRLDDTGGSLLAMRSAAGLITRLLPDGTASQIRRITGGRELQTTDDLLRAAGNPEPAVTHGHARGLQATVRIPECGMSCSAAIRDNRVSA